jgi:hypothetical protein
MYGYSKSSKVEAILIQYLLALIDTIDCISLNGLTPVSDLNRVTLSCNDTTGIDVHVRLTSLYVSHVNCETSYGRVFSPVGCCFATA